MGLLRRHGRHGGRVNGLMRRDGRALDGRVKGLLRRHGRHGGRAYGLMRRDGRVVLIASPLRQKAKAGERERERLVQVRPPLLERPPRCLTRAAIRLGYRSRCYPPPPRRARTGTADGRIIIDGRGRWRDVCGRWPLALRAGVLGLGADFQVLIVRLDAAGAPADYAVVPGTVDGTGAAFGAAHAYADESGEPSWHRIVRHEEDGRRVELVPWMDG